MIYYIKGLRYINDQTLSYLLVIKCICFYSSCKISHVMKSGYQGDALTVGCIEACTSEEKTCSNWVKT